MFAQGVARGRLQFIAVGREHFVESVRGGEDDFGDSGGVLLGQLRGEHVLELVGQLAQLAKTAGRRIALQRVHGAANVAKLFLVARLLFERETGFVHILENLLRALEKEVAKLRSVFVGRKAHCGPSIR